MRIIGGARRGTHLAPVGEGDAKAHLRPTSDRVREAIFNLLINGGYGAPLQDAHVLDLFAGTGALGLEALSRGAAHASFVETGAAALALLRRNIEILRMGPATAILRRDATAPGPKPAAPFDVVFLDPPYGKGRGGGRARRRRPDRLASPPTALVVWEEST
ncbi:16S rRNA (guanine(966)-N(2))-methyltransferase RsmD, partial [Cereibacter changlensis JA139]